MKIQIIHDMKPGTRFWYDGYQSLMIASDMFINYEGFKCRVCISDKGICRLIGEHEECFIVSKKKNAKIVNISKKIVENIISKQIINRALDKLNEKFD